MINVFFQEQEQNSLIETKNDIKDFFENAFNNGVYDDYYFKDDTYYYKVIDDKEINLNEV